MKWLDDAQEFVWMDAVKIGARIYHASCHAEAKKDGGTPEPVLGKRKNEVRSRRNHCGRPFANLPAGA